MFRGLEKEKPALLNLQAGNRVNVDKMSAQAKKRPVHAKCKLSKPSVHLRTGKCSEHACTEMSRSQKQSTIFLGCKVEPEKFLEFASRGAGQRCSDRLRDGEIQTSPPQRGTKRDCKIAACLLPATVSKRAHIVTDANR